MCFSVTFCISTLLTRTCPLNKEYLGMGLGNRAVTHFALCMGENKGADQLRSNCEADQRLCFRYTDFYFKLKLQTSSLLVWLYRPVCVGPCWNLNCRFSHAQAHFMSGKMYVLSNKALCHLPLFDPFVIL